MAAGEEEVRPAPSRPEPKPTVRRRQWEPKPHNVKALDRHIAHVYGPEYVARSRR